MVGEQREARVGSASTVRQYCVARENAEVTEGFAKRIRLMGIGANAGDDFSIAALNGPQRAPQCDYAARSPERNIVEPARRDSQVLRQTDC